MTVHRDPRSGRFIEPPQGQVELENDHARQGVEPELVQRTNPIGGGVSVDLEGRFQSVSRVRRDAEGKLVVDCLEGDTAHGGVAR